VESDYSLVSSIQALLADHFSHQEDELVSIARRRDSAKASLGLFCTRPRTRRMQAVPACADARCGAALDRGNRRADSDREYRRLQVPTRHEANAYRHILLAPHDLLGPTRPVQQHEASISDFGCATCVRRARQRCSGLIRARTGTFGCSWAPERAEDRTRPAADGQIFHGLLMFTEID
jgi:hypothetical protein